MYAMYVLSVEKSKSFCVENDEVCEYMAEQPRRSRRFWFAKKYDDAYCSKPIFRAQKSMKRIRWARLPLLQRSS